MRLANIWYSPKVYDKNTHSNNADSTSFSTCCYHVSKDMNIMDSDSIYAPIDN